MARLRRMTSTQMESVIAYRDDILVATDTGNIFVSGSDLATKVMVGKAMIGETADLPDAGVAGRFFYDTTLGSLFLDNGTEWVNASLEGSSFVHASSHIRGATDEIDGDKLDIDWNPSNYTPVTASGLSTSVDDLTSHLKGIDNAILGHEHTTIAGIGVAVPEDGASCTIDITANGGAITAAVVNAGGSGYQVDDILTVAGGSNGTVTVATIDSGAVLTVTVSAAGTGYTTGTGVATTTTSARAWVATNLAALDETASANDILKAIDDDLVEHDHDSDYATDNHNHDLAYQAILDGTTTLGDLGLPAPDPAYSGALTGITTTSTLAQLLAAIDSHTHA